MKGNEWESVSGVAWERAVDPTKKELVVFFYLLIEEKDRRKCGTHSTRANGIIIIREGLSVVSCYTLVEHC